METGKQTILIIEDDAGLLELISEKIESCGYQTALVQSAEKAIEWLKAHTAFLMVLDYGLPDMNGKEVIAELKTQKILVPPFMVCTGQGDERIAVDMMKLGARDYIIKDSMFLEMLPLVVSWIAKVIENENKLKLTEQALIESAQFNKQIIESVQEGVIVCDRNLICQAWNPYMENLTGIPATDVIGKFQTELFPFLQDSGATEKLRKVIQENHILETESSIDLPVSGKSGWFSNTISTLFNAVDEVNGVIITVHDITERKKAEEALKDSEQRYRLLIETANEGIVVAQNGLLKFANPMMQELTGFTKEELLTLPFTEYVHPEDRKLLISNQLKRLIEDQVVPKYHYRLFKKDGSTKWIEMNGVKIEWEGQSATLNVLTDITERIQAEEEIRLKNEQLLKLNAEKDRFFSIIAHDLRSPFNGFLGLTEIMAEELQTLTMAQIQEISVSMRSSATNLSHLLENLLQWARMQQGLIPFEPEIIKLNPIVIESITLMMEPAKNKGIDLTYDIPPEINVLADRNMLQTVIRNMISNAVKFTPKGGKISISTKVTEDKSVEISIKDTGIGMNHAMIGNLFSLDVKTNRKGTEGEPSSGLGLLLCKEFVEKQGGKIWVESEEEKGTRFCFTVPM
jgi:PAS domain S-box-containing protein